MLRQTVTLLKKNIITCTKVENLSTTCKKNQKWDLLTAVCLERKPLITPALNDIEKQYKELLATVELERSLKSDHELRHELEVKQLELLKAGSADDFDLSVKQTAQDYVDACNEELSKFKYAPKVTEADKKNDIKSLDRKLDKHLVLVVNQKIGNQKYYLLPQGIREDGESLKQTAERVLKNSCGKDVKFQIYGNAPSGFYKYKYPKGVQNENGAVGAKVFIYFARHQSGQLPLKGSDFKWLDRKELNQVLPEEYSNSVSKLLVDE